MLIGSSLCTYFSLLQELNKAAHKDKPGWLEKHEVEEAKTVKHIECCCSLYRYQLEQGRQFLHEHPWTARSWNVECVDKILKHPAVGVTQTHKCRFLMTTHIEHRGGEVGPVRKPTGLMSSSSYVLIELDRKCVAARRSYFLGGRTCFRATDRSRSSARGGVLDPARPSGSCHVPCSHMIRWCARWRTVHNQSVHQCNDAPCNSVHASTFFFQNDSFSATS